MLPLYCRTAAFLTLMTGLFLGTTTAAVAQTPNIVTSIKPLQLIAIAVTGEPSRVESLLSPRFSPHDYQFRPSDREMLERADVVFWIGPGFETFLRGPLTNLPARVKVVALQPPGTQLSEDGHIWMDPVHAIAIARRMAEALAEVEPGQRDRWQRNAEQLAAALMREDESLRQELGSLRQPRQFLVAHDTFDYFEDRYHLRHAAALADNAEQPSGARNLLSVQKMLDEGRIGCVFREPQYEPKVLQTLLRDRPQMRVVTLDTMATDISLKPEGIVEFYRELGRGAVSCLKP